MAQKIKYAIFNLEGETGKIFAGDLNRKLYEDKYRGHLTCIKGCKAKIKFTEKKNIKFFSTWNKEGHLHDEDCPYNINYTGKKRIYGYFSKIWLSDEDVFRRLKRKMMELLRKNHKTNSKDSSNNNTSISSTITQNTENLQDNGGDAYTPRIRYEDADYVDTDDIGTRISVYGFINNVQLNTDKKGYSYAYFNLITLRNTVNIAFPEAFYFHEMSGGKVTFENYISKVKKLVEKNPNEVMVIAYGDITKKKRDKSGVNVSVISPNHILVNNKSYDEIIYDTNNK